jgi:chitin synthase
MRNKIPANAQREIEQTDDVLLVAGKDVADLTSLTTPNEQDVAVTLRARMLDKNTYTAIGSSVLVSLNPFHHADEDVQNEGVQKYIREYKYPLETKERLEPHIFQLTADVYLRMRRLAENQVIMFRYEFISARYRV